MFCKTNLERNVTVENVLQILEAADRSQETNLICNDPQIIIRPSGGNQNNILEFVIHEIVIG